MLKEKEDYVEIECLQIGALELQDHPPADLISNNSLKGKININT